MSETGERVGAALLVGVVTMGLDLLFHLTLTMPMEIPVYFLAKFFVAFLIAYFLISRIGALWSAVLFTFAFDIYYAVGVLLLHIPGLSASPTQIIEIAGFGSQCLGYAGCDLLTESGLLVLWTFFHGLFFYVGYLLVNSLGEGFYD